MWGACARSDVSMSAGTVFHCRCVYQPYHLFCSMLELTGYCGFVLASLSIHWGSLNNKTVILHCAGRRFKYGFHFFVFCFFREARCQLNRSISGVYTLPSWFLCNVDWICSSWHLYFQDLGISECFCHSAFSPLCFFSICFCFRAACYCPSWNASWAIHRCIATNKTGLWKTVDIAVDFKHVLRQDPLLAHSERTARYPYRRTSMVLPGRVVVTQCPVIFGHENGRTESHCIGLLVRRVEVP